MAVIIGACRSVESLFGCLRFWPSGSDIVLVDPLLGSRRMSDMYARHDADNREMCTCNELFQKLGASGPILALLHEKCMRMRGHGQDLQITVVSSSWNRGRISLM